MCPCGYTYRRCILKQLVPRRLLLDHPVLPFHARLLVEEIREEVHLGAPLARAGAGAVVVRLAVSLSAEELGCELVEVGFGVGFPELQYIYVYSLADDNGVVNWEGERK